MVQLPLLLPALRLTFFSLKKLIRRGNMSQSSASLPIPRDDSTAAGSAGGTAKGSAASFMPAGRRPASTRLRACSSSAGL